LPVAEKIVVWVVRILFHTKATEVETIRKSHWMKVQGASS
jgi:hypothetical protein